MDRVALGLTFPDSQRGNRLRASLQGIPADSFHTSQFLHPLQLYVKGLTELA